MWMRPCIAAGVDGPGWARGRRGRAHARRSPVAGPNFAGRRAKGAEQREHADPDAEGHEHPYQAGDRGAPAIIVDPLHGVTGHGAVLQCMVAGGVDEPLVGRNPLEPIRLGRCQGADEEGQTCSDQEAGDHEQLRVAHAARSRTAAREGLGVRSDAPYTRSGRTATTAPTVSPVITPSPIPISRCTPTMAPPTVPKGIDM